MPCPTPLLVLSASAIMPGRMTRNGNSIFGTAAMSGVRRAAVIESAAMARCTTRKSVHQYPNDSTNPSPITSPNHSTPIGFVAALSIPCHACVYDPAGSPCATAASDSFAVKPSHPPTLRSPIHTRGTKPKTIMKNCSTSL